MTNFYDQLNSAQKQAVDTTDGPILVLAGPGTGKTQLISARVANILTKTDTPAESILCLTFTETGARNMRNRLTSLIKDEAYKVEINTYHGFSQTIISQNRDYFLDQNLVNTADDITKFDIMSKIIEALPTNDILKRIKAKDLISTISELKQALITPELLALVAQENKSQLESAGPEITAALADMKTAPRNYQKSELYFSRLVPILEKHKPRKSVINQFETLLEIGLRELQKSLIEAEEIQKSTPLTAWKNRFLEKDDQGHFVYKDDFNLLRLERMVGVYKDYTSQLESRGLYDFDDMILKAIDAINKHPSLKFNLQEKYLYILLDEYQDTNRAQSRIIELLTDNPVNEGRPNVMAVGDDDQAIFAFQGARFSNMIEFFDRYRDTKLINLSENYRSHADILKMAGGVATQIEQRLINNLKTSKVSKDLVASNKSITAAEICRLDFANSLSENAWLAEKIADLKSSGEDLNEIAILAPKHKLLEALAPYLAEKNLPIRYEKSENALENPGVKFILCLAKLLIALNKQQPHNHLLFETLSYPIWQIDIPLLWKLSWSANRQKSWLEHILETEDFASLRPLALWLLESATKINKMSLAASFDLLIGNIELEINQANKTETFRSPIKAHYSQAEPKTQIDFMLDINLLRENFLAFCANQPPSTSSPLEQLVQLTESYERADQKMARVNSYNENSQAVNLMTVFGAKGLEFKYVFLLETNDNNWGKSRSASNSFSLPDNLQPIRHDTETMDEKARLFFVAITRAKTHLFLLNSLASLTGKPTNRLRFLTEIESEDGFKSLTIPDVYSKIRYIEPSPTFSELSLNLNDSFSDWQTRHYDGRLAYADLLQPKLDKLKLSATSVNNFTDLMYHGPDDYFLSHILGFPSAYSLNMVYGTLIHQTLESLSRQPESSPSRAIEVFEQKLSELNLIESDYNQLKERGQTSLPKFIASRSQLFNTPPEIKIVTEVDFNTRNVVLGEARLTGKIDRAEINTSDKTITIVDFKTGKPRPRLDLNDASLYYNLKQLYFYYLLAKNSTVWLGYKITNWRLEFVDPDRQDKIHFLAGEFEPEMLARVEKLIKAVWMRTMKLDFSKPELYKDPTLKDIKLFENQLIDEIGEL